MRYHKPAMFLALLACIAFQASAQDLLNPMALGESMSMPLSPDLVRQAENAGVKVGSAATGGIQQGETLSQPPVALGSGAAESDPASAGPWSEAGANTAPGAGAVSSAPADPSASDVNVTGMWTFTLQDELARRLDLALFQNGDAILGYGNLASGNSTQGVTAGGSVANGKVNLLITSQGGLSMYRLNLVPEESSLSGSYSAFTSSGDSWSGTASGSIPGQQGRAQPQVKSQVKPQVEPQTETQSSDRSAAGSSLSPAALGQGSGASAQSSTASSKVGSYGSSGRTSSYYPTGSVSSSQSISMSAGGGSFSSVSSTSSSM